MHRLFANLGFDRNADIMVGGLVLPSHGLYPAVSILASLVLACLS